MESVREFITTIATREGLRWKIYADFGNRAKTGYYSASEILIGAGGTEGYEGVVSSSFVGSRLTFSSGSGSPLDLHPAKEPVIAMAATAISAKNILFIFVVSKPITLLPEI